MTKFEELTDLIGRNKNKSAKKIIANDNDKQDDNDIQLEVSGTESTRGPLVASAADDQLDPDLVDMLYTKPHHVPNRGEGASIWDSDY
jgi:hypothetical protein